VGIGVRVLAYNYEDGFIIMEAGIILGQFVQQNMNGP
jgi:hypothetical protein